MSSPSPPENATRDSQRHRGAKITVSGVTRRFGDFEALKDVSLEIAPGEIAVIIGGSGAGKTTLLKLLIALDSPTSGTIALDDRQLTGLSERELNRERHRMGMVFQYSALLDSMSILDNVAFPLREHRRDLSEKEIKERVIDKLQALDLKNIEDKLPSQLSGGMKKRAALARALMLEPAALFYDEPTSGLDPLSARLVDRMIVETRDRFGVTSVVISHDMAGALNIADQLHLISQGRIVTSGSPSELSRGKHPLARSFFEASGIRLGT